MDKGRFLVETHLRAGQSIGELAKAHGVHRSWLYKLLKRYRTEGESGLELRSRRPKSSFRRFEADLPNDCWQADVTHVAIADGSFLEVLNIVDDLSRLCVASRAFVTVRSPDVVRTLHRAAERLGYPESLLTDNGAIFTASPRRNDVG